MTNISLKHLLGDAVGPRSHFLPVTPMITIGENIIGEGTQDSEVSFVLHHEYLHYEQFITWPLTLFEYMDNAVRVRKKFAQLHAVSELAGDEMFPSRNTVLPYDSFGWDDRLVAAMQSKSFRIGRSALLEGGALLDCFCKPPTDKIARFGVSVLESLFRNRDMSRNRPHVIGVESCLAAAGLGNQDFRDHQRRELFALAASLPNLVVTRTLASSLRSLGFPTNQWDYPAVFNFVLHNFGQIRTTYEKHLTEALNLVFTIRDGIDWLLDVLDLRDLTIAITHALIDVSYQVMNVQVPKSAPAFPILAPQWSLLSLLKCYEAMNEQTLHSYGVPILRPEWVPVPALIFTRRKLTSIQFEPRADGLRGGSIRVGGQWKSVFQGQTWVNWLRVAIFNSVEKAIDDQETDVICPFRKWVWERYLQIGVNDENVLDAHLKEMCEEILDFSENSYPLDGSFAPSNSYCMCSFINVPERIGCYFKSAMKELLLPTSTVEEVESNTRSSG